MVDVSNKEPTRRSATATGVLWFGDRATSPAIYERLPADSDPLRIDLETAKGSVFSVAELAGILGAKQTSSLIPLCHPLPLSLVKVACQLAAGPSGRRGISVTCTAATVGRTGVEMEALTGCTVALLTVYDMCKALDSHMELSSVRVIRKTGGKRDFSLQLSE